MISKARNALYPSLKSTTCATERANHQNARSRLAMRAPRCAHRQNQNPYTPHVSVQLDQLEGSTTRLHFRILLRINRASIDAAS